MRVLVATSSTADDRKTLGVVRALGRAGHAVAVGGDRTDAAPFRSRYCRAAVTYANPAADLDRFADDLVRHLAASRYDAVLPLDDYTTTAMARHAAAIGRHAGLAVPDPAALEAARDKVGLTALAARIGLPVPETHAPTSAAEAAALARRIGYPCIVKPRRGSGAAGVRVADTAEALLALLARPTEAPADCVFDFDRPMVQDYVPGELFDVCLLFDRGEPRAALTQRRLLMHPRTGGLGAIVETVDEPAIREQGIALLRALNWHGPAQVEFRRDARDGKARLIEVNGRFWATVDLAIRAGVDFARLTAELAAQGRVAEAGDYRVGLRYRWPVFFALPCMRESATPLRTLWRFFEPGAISDFAWHDPLPNLVNLARSLRPQR